MSDPGTDPENQVCVDPQRVPAAALAFGGADDLGPVCLASPLIRTPGPLGLNDVAAPGQRVCFEGEAVPQLPPDLRRPMFDQVAVQKYKSRTADGPNYVRGRFVFELQTLLVSFGFAQLGTPDGDFGNKTLDAVRAFQEIARTDRRTLASSGAVKQVSITYPGGASGTVDLDTWDEVRLWRSEGYRVPILTFPDTEFRYQPTRKSLDSCLATLSTDLRTETRQLFAKVIREMHTLGFAFGVWEKVHAGYRTFATQHGIDPSKTKAGPGESFHNYGAAVDLGCLEWVDEDGNARADFWLGLMDGLPKYKGLSAKIWARRNSVAAGQLHALSWETIHLQIVPANASGPTQLVACLNRAAQDAGDTTWRYRIQSKRYECNLGNGETFVRTGTAKQMWTTAATNCNSVQRQKIKAHMAAAEAIAKTISLT